MERRKTVEDIIESKMAQRFLVGGIRQEESDLLDELLGMDYSVVSLPGSESVLRQSGRGEPSGGNLPDCRETAVFSPPPTNRGVSKHQNREISFGGYDGPAEIGFEGDWDSEKFTELKIVLDRAKELAGESPSLSEDVTLFGDHVVSVDASGARAGLFYRYKFTIGGVTFFVHHNCPSGRQAVRVRYGAMALIGRSLFDVHAAVLRILSELGFTVTKETVSRIDMQVTLSVSTEELLGLILSGYAVSKVRNDTVYRKSGVCRTFLIGERGRMQNCIYNKSSEMQVMAVSNPAKFQLMVDHHLGSDYTFDQLLTRVEFRLWRDVLRLFEINTVEDLRLAETDIVHFLTTKWLRVLSVPKADVKGHENRAQVHSLWERIQRAFLEYFPGVGRPVREITLSREKPVTCESLALQRQALGCLKTAMALSSGVQSSVDVLYAMACEWLDGVKYELFAGVNERVSKLRVETGVSIASFGREKVREWLSGLIYERGRCFG